MRVMQVIAGAAEGGAETFYVSLVSVLQRAGLDQRAVIRSNPRRAAQLRQAGLEPLELPFGRWLDFETGAALRREVAAYRPDVVLTWMSRASQVMPQGDFLRLARLGNRYKLKNFRNCDHLLCIAPHIAEYCVAGGWPRQRVHYMPNFSLMEAAAPIDRAALDTPAGAPLLLALSRLHPAKGLDTLLHALVREPRAYLWIAGEGPLRAELEQLAASLGVAERVRFLGWRSDRAALLAACDIVVFPSRYEPFGTVSLEAWGYRKPLVVAAADGPAGLVRPGEDALLVPTDDAAALAEGITQVIDDPALAARLVAAGQARYETEFTEEACVRRYLALFERLLAERRQPVAV